MSNKAIGSVRSYTVGFILSVILTLSAYIPVVLRRNWDNVVFSSGFLIPWVISLAVLQLFVQLIFFLHLGHEKGPRWNTGFFIATVGIMLLVVLGSLWIMYHLNYNMMPQDVNSYIENKEGIHYSTKH